MNFSRLFLDDPHVEADPASAIVKEGGQVNLRCTGTPAVEFLWYRNGSNIINNGNSHVSSFGTLLLSNIKQSDAGMYVCAAKNKKGFAVATASLNVGRKLNSVLARLSRGCAGHGAKLSQGPPMKYYCRRGEACCTVDYILPDTNVARIYIFS